MVTALSLRRIPHPQASNNYRVVWNEIEIGSIGLQSGPDLTRFWRWAIDTVLPPQGFATRGDGADLKDCKRQFADAWERFSSDPARLAEFLEIKRNASGQSG